MKKINPVTYETIQTLYKIWEKSEGTEKSFFQLIPAESHRVEDMIAFKRFSKDGKVNGKFNEAKLRQHIMNLSEGKCTVKNKKGYEDLEPAKAPKMFIRGVVLAKLGSSDNTMFHLFVECEHGHRFAKQYTNLFSSPDPSIIHSNCPKCSAPRPKESGLKRNYKWKNQKASTIKGYLTEGFNLDPNSFELEIIEPTASGAQKYLMIPKGDPIIIQSSNEEIPPIIVRKPVEMNQSDLAAALNPKSRSHESALGWCFRSQANTIFDLKEMCLEAEEILNADLDSNEDTKNMKLKFIVKGEDHQTINEVYGVAMASDAKITYTIRLHTAPPRKKTAWATNIQKIVATGSVFDKSKRRFIGCVERKQDAAPSHGFRMYLAAVKDTNGDRWLKIGHTRHAMPADRFGPENRSQGADVRIIGYEALDCRTVPTKGHMEAIERELRAKIRSYCRKNFAENYRFGDHTSEDFPLTCSGGNSECVLVNSLAHRIQITQHARVLMDHLTVIYGEGIRFDKE